MTKMLSFLNVINRSTAQGLPWLLLICSFAIQLTLVTQLHHWMIAIIALIYLLRILQITEYLFIAKWLVVVIALIGCIVLFITGKSLGLLLAMVHLLCFSYAMKQFELTTKKDVFQQSLLGVFLLATALIFEQSLLFSSIIFLLLLANLAVLIAYISPKAKLKFSIKLSGLMLLQSIPLAVVLFVLLPRLAPFWEVPLAKSDKTGLSETVSLGDISRLIKSDELAFRVNFLSNKPSYNQLYWRALVLENFDGKTWTKYSYKHGLPSKSNQLSLGNETRQYQVIVEPNYQRWMFSLKNSIKPNQHRGTIQAKKLPNDTFISSEPIVQTSSYFLAQPIVQQHQKIVNLLRVTKKRNLSLPKNVNPKLVQYGKSLNARFKNKRQLIQQVLNTIQQNDYRYTLQPPTLVGDQLDQFFFSTKAGFCVHYASAFTFLMRAAGIPARLVTGYMGGEYNIQGDYYSIYQYDAHAWSEVWLPETGWTRIDPTSAVSPERVEQGFSYALFNNEQSATDRFFQFLGYQKGMIIPFITQQLKAMDFQWTRWVVGFTSEKQSDLLTAWFGQLSSVKLLIIILSCFTVIVLLLYFLFQRNARTNSPVHQQLFDKLLLKLEKQGLKKPRESSAIDFSQQVNHQTDNPKLGELFHQFCVYYEQIQYQAISSAQQREIQQKMKTVYQQLTRCLKNTHR